MRGVINLGNTCYFSAALQLLAHVPVLVRYIFGHEYTGDCPITQEFYKFIYEIYSVDEIPVNPRALLTAFQERFTQFKMNEMHDTQEVVLIFLDIFEKHIGKIIPTLFYGKETVETTCPSGVSSMTEPWVTLNLIPREAGETLDVMLERKQKPHVIKGYTDAAGDTHHISAQNTEVTVWPRIIMITFQDKQVVDLPETFQGKKLFLSVVHFGAAHFGHYSVLARRYDKWYVKDDERIYEYTGDMKGIFYMACYR